MRTNSKQLTRRNRNNVNLPKSKNNRNNRQRIPRAFIARSTSTEVKFFDTANSFSIDATAEVPATGQLALIPQGATQSTRIGRTCLVTSIDIKWIALYVPGASGNATLTFSIVLVLDQQCNGAAAAFTDVFQNDVLPIALINVSNSRRFRILKRWTFSTSSQAGVSAAYNSKSQFINFRTPCRIPLDFSSTTGALTELKTNNLFLLAGTDGTNDDLVSLNGNTRLHFTDD